MEASWLLALQLKGSRNQMHPCFFRFFFFVFSCVFSFFMHLSLLHPIASLTAGYSCSYALDKEHRKNSWRIISEIFRTAGSHSKFNFTKINSNIISRESVACSQTVSALRCQKSCFHHSHSVGLQPAEPSKNVKL